jgi:hypothetical protein
MQSFDPAPDRTFQRLTDLRNGLIKLHKSLLDSERASYERDVERVTSSNHLLSLVLHDPWFAWLRQLSELVVLIDETLDADEPATAADARRLIDQSRTLVSPSEAGQGFNRRYYEAMQRDPDVVIAHGEMMRVFSLLG